MSKWIPSVSGYTKPVEVFHYPLIGSVYVAPMSTRAELLRCIIQWVDAHAGNPDTQYAYPQFMHVLDVLIQMCDPWFNLPLEVDLAIVSLLASTHVLQEKDSGETYFTRLNEGQYEMS